MTVTPELMNATAAKYRNGTLYVEDTSLEEISDASSLESISPSLLNEAAEALRQKISGGAVVINCSGPADLIPAFDRAAAVRPVVFSLFAAAPTSGAEMQSGAQLQVGRLADWLSGSWCSDCRNSAPCIDKAFSGPDASHIALVLCTVTRPEWKGSPDHPYRAM